MTTTEAEVLADTPAGLLRRGDGFFYRRQRQSGWLTATSLSTNGLWVYARDRKSMARIIEISAIRKIGPAPEPYPQRIIKQKRTRRRR